MVTNNNRATTLRIYAMVIDGVAIGTNLIFGKISDTSLSLAFARRRSFLYTRHDIVFIWDKK